jgi:hypothetical protein
MRRPPTQADSSPRVVNLFSQLSQQHLNELDLFLRYLFFRPLSGADVRGQAELFERTQTAHCWTALCAFDAFGGRAGVTLHMKLYQPKGHVLIEARAGNGPS